MSIIRVTMAIKKMSLVLFSISAFACVKVSAATSSYTFSGSSVTPQGQFLDANGTPVTISVSKGKITFSSSNVASIGSYAFHNCSGLTYFDLPESVTDIGYFAFSNCDKLTKSICNNTIFARLPISATSCEIAAGTKEIASAAFRKCTKLTAVTLPNSIVTIGESAFADCTELSSINIPASTKTIGEYAFKNCTKLSAIYVESSAIPHIGEHTFDGVVKSSCVLFVPQGKASVFSSWNFPNVVEMPEKDDLNASVVTVKGKYSGDAFIVLNNYINESEALVVDLSQATEVNGELKFEENNKNVLIRTSKKASELKLQNKDNVIVNGTCQNLVINDGSPFGVDKQFTATKASYGRTMTSAWGTICLPFEVSSNENVQYYATGSVKDYVLTLNTTTKVAAGHPAIFKRINGVDLAISTGTVNVVIAEQNSSIGTTSDEIHLYGTFSQKILSDDGVYYIAKDKFWLRLENEDVMVNAFRAWFTLNSKEAPSRSFSIEEFDNEVASLEALKAMSEGTALYFDEQGHQLHDLQKGITIVRMSNGKTKKILLK